MSTLNLVTAAAAAQLIRDDISRNFSSPPGAAGEGEAFIHRDPNKLNKEAALDALRADETLED